MGNHYISLPSDQERIGPFGLGYGCAVFKIAAATWIRIVLDPALGG